MLGAILNACRNQSNFYSVTVYLSRSGRSLLILANFGFLFALACGKILQKIFFGPLQPREVERLYDQTWMFVTESLLAFTIFRDEFDIPFLMMFGFLLFVKCFHWLMADRVESMEQVPFPGPTLSFHLRINGLFAVLLITDAAMFGYAVDSTLMNGVGGMVLFATEYAILIASTLNAMSRYILNILEWRRAIRRGGENAPPWESKSMYVFYIELVTDFLKLTTYLTFFMIILTFYGLPLNIIRDVYITARSFITRLRALIRYHNATRDMDRRYPNATEEELAAMSDRTCIICREELTAPGAPATVDGQAGQEGPQREEPRPQEEGPNMTPKKLPCGHIFHFQCLRSWLERQQSCPTWNNAQQPQQQGQQQQAQPNGGRGVPIAQPGAMPVPQQAQAGVGGWLGRFLGIAPPPQPPLVVPPQYMVHPQPPGFVGVPPPPHAGQPGQAGAYYPAQQLPPGYAYAYPYPQPMYQYPIWPNAYGAQVYQPQHQQLNPAPHLRGFQGPGGQIHPWPIAPHHGVPPAQAQQGATQQPTHQQQSSQGAQVTPTPVSTSVQVPAQRTRTESETSTTSASTSSSSSGESDAQREELSATPRNAAAAAALRRLDALVSSQVPAPVSTRTQSNGPSSGTSVASGTTTNTHNNATNGTESGPQPTPTAPSPPSPQPAVIASTPTPPATSPPSSSTAPAPAQPQTSTQGSTSQGRINLPSLIPAPDLSPRPAPPIAYAYPYPQAGQLQPPYRFAPPSTTVRAQMTFPAGPPPPYAQPAQHQHQMRQQQQNQQHHPPPYRTPISELPPTLTDEQLGRLDRLTREAIDERLRVLEGVSGAVYRCIEELTRMRSVLPRPTQAPSVPQNVNAAASSSAAPATAEGSTPPVTSASDTSPPTADDGHAPVFNDLIEASVAAQELPINGHNGEANTGVPEISNANEPSPKVTAPEPDVQEGHALPPPDGATDTNGETGRRRNVDDLS
ncbi:unnamed protein product [Somion occarium]|uniref:RING-type E3 ubiquitin transferase n=1 Tax=Somion occarium TaxID=3059160 RepID=A0ABP1DM00_9APHY